MFDSWDSMDCILSGFSVHGISQARILKWVSISFSRGSSQSKDWIWVSCISGSLLHCRWILYWLSHQGRPIYNIQQCWLYIGYVLYIKWIKIVNIHTFSYKINTTNIIHYMINTIDKNAHFKQSPQRFLCTSHCWDAWRSLLKVDIWLHGVLTVINLSLNFLCYEIRISENSFLSNFTCSLKFSMLT